MIRKQSCLILLVAVSFLFLASRVAVAIGPQYQVIGDPVAAGAGPLNDVTSLLLANGIENGTGSVIGVSAPNANNVVTMAVLTARHVAVSAVTTANFGVGPGEAGAPGVGPYLLSANLNGTFVGFTLVDPVNNPNNRPQDLAIMKARVKVPAGGAALAEFNLVTNPANIFLLAPFPTTPPAPGMTVAANNQFTEIGYGTAGTYDTANTVYTPSVIANDDARRFQNNTVTSVDGSALITRGGVQYYQPEVNWSVMAPSAAGGGASFPGDSGGPYLTGGVLAQLNANSVSVTPSFVDPNNVNNPLPSNVAINIPLSYTDYLSAVHVAGAAPKTVGAGGFGVPLVQTGSRRTGSLNWALHYANNPTAIPEPNSLLLILAGNCCWVLLARRGCARRE